MNNIYSIAILLIIAIAMYHTTSSTSLSSLQKRIIYFILFFPVFILLTLYTKLPVIVCIVLCAVLFIITRILGGAFAITHTIYKFRRNVISPQKNQTKISTYTDLLVSFLILFLILWTNGTIIPLVFLFYPLYRFIWPSRGMKAIKLQTRLSTSTIASAPMGLVELKGNLQYIPKYIIYTDDTGSTTFKDDSDLSFLMLTDNTGSVKIDSKNLKTMFFNVPVERFFNLNFNKNNHGIRNGMEVLAIGLLAIDESDQPILKYDKQHDVFTVIPLRILDKYNKFLPAINLFISYLCILGFLISLILMSDIYLTDNVLRWEWPEFKFRWIE